MNRPPDRPPRSPALEDELAALELLLEDAKRKRQQAEGEEAKGSDGEDLDNDVETSPGGE